MYCDFFGLRCRPFEDRADPRFFHATADAAEALAAMEYESHFGKGASLILGEAGTGKTLLVRTLLQQLHTTDHVVVLTWVSDGPSDLIHETCRGFGVSFPSSSHRGRVVPRLRRHLLRTHQAEHPSILIVDQVENLTVDNIVQLSTLLNIQHNGQKLLNVILIGQPHFREKLAGSELAGVRQHLFGERTLKALTLSETQAYVEHRLRVAGAGDTNLFDSKAVAQVHQASGGVPRLVNHMCEAALLAAYGARQSTIGEAIAAEVVGQCAPKERTVAAEHLGLGSSTKVASGWQDRQAPFVAVDTRAATAGRSSRDAQQGEPIAASSEWIDHRSDASCAEAASIAATRPAATLDGANGFSVADQALVRLERALDRAERMTATSDAAAARCAAVEKHLARLMGGADGLATTLTDSIQRASHSLDSVQVRLNRIFDDGDVRLSKIGQRVAQLTDASVETEEQADRLDRACETGRQVEARLTKFAGQLADKADDVQQHIAGMMSGVAANEEARGKLTALIDKAGRVTVETDERIQALQQTLKEGEAEAQVRRERLTDQLLEEFRGTLKAKAGEYERSLLVTVETARETLAGLTERTASTVNDADKRMGQLRATVKEAGHEASKVKEQLVASVHDAADKARRTLDGLVDAGSQRLEHELEEKTRSTLAAADTACKTLADLTERTASTVNDADKRMGQLRATVKEAGHEASKVKEQLVASVHDAADKARRTLDGLVDAGSQRLEHELEEKTRSTLVAADTACKTLADLTERTASTVNDADRRMAQLRATVKEAGNEASKVKERLVESAVSRYRQQLTKCVIDHVHSYEEAVEATVAASRETMAETTESFDRSVADLEKRVATARQATDDAASVCEKSVTARISQADQGIDALGRRIKTLEKRRDDVEKVLSALNTDVEGSISRVEGLDALIKDQSPAVDALTSKAESAGTQLSTTVSRAETLVQEAKEASAQIVTLQQTTSTTLVQLGDVCERLGEARTELRDSEETLARLGAARGDVERMIGDLDKALSSARPIQEIAERILPESAQQTRQLESQIVAAAEIHQQLDTAVDTGRAIVDQADAVRELAGRLTEVQSAGDTTASQLEQILASAQPVLQAVRQTMSQASEQERRLESTRASVTGVLDDLSLATADARGLSEGIADDIRKAIEVSDSTADHVAHMQATRDSGTRIMQELTDLIGSAGDIHKSLQGVVAHTDEKLGRLESHGTTATRTLGELSAGTSKGEVVAKQLSDATENVRRIGAETVARIDRSIRDVWDLNSRTEVNLKSLTTKNAKAVEVTRELADVLGPAGETLADMTKRSDDAKAVTASMGKHIDNAVRLANRIQSLSTLLETVQRTEESVTQTAILARTTRDKLVDATEEAAARCDSLTDVGAHTQGLIETHEQIQQDAESVVRRLAAQLTTGKKAAQAAQPLLEDFIAQSREVDEHLREAKRESQRIEESVKQSTERPAELIAAAQRQAAELERVCEAVRKVFSGLSKASLEARNDTNAFHKAGGEAQEEFAQVTAEAGRAAATLKEWVQEALRAQTRLARTLKEAPSIHETHPPGAPHGTPEVAQHGRRTGTPGATGELEVLRTPDASSTSKPPGQPTRRAETITRLIEDAKKASAVGSA